MTVLTPLGLPRPRPQQFAAQCPGRQKEARSSVSRCLVRREATQTQGGDIAAGTHNEEVVHLGACDGGGQVAALQGAPLVLLRVYPRPQRQLGQWEREALRGAGDSSARCQDIQWRHGVKVGHARTPWRGARGQLCRLAPHRVRLVTRAERAPTFARAGAPQSSSPPRRVWAPSSNRARGAKGERATRHAPPG